MPSPRSLRENDCVFNGLAHEFRVAYLIPHELAAKDRDWVVYGEPAQVPRRGVGCRERELIMRRVCAGRGKLTAKAGRGIFRRVPPRSQVRETGAPSA